MKGLNDRSRKRKDDDVMVKLAINSARLSAITDLFHDVDQGEVIACHVQVCNEQGKLERDPMVTIFTAPRGTEADKALYQATVPRINGQRDLALMGYFDDGCHYSYITGTSLLNMLVDQPQMLTQLQRGLAEIQNGPKGVASTRVFFAGDIDNNKAAFGRDLVSVVSNGGTWMRTTPNDGVGLVIAELLKGEDRQLQKVLAYRTDGMGRRVSLVQIDIETLVKRPQLFTQPNDKEWQQIGALPDGFDGSFMWLGRLKRDALSMTQRTGIMGLTGNQAVQITVDQDAGTVTYGKIQDAPHIPASIFRIGEVDTGYVLSQPTDTGTIVTIGNRGLPQPYGDFIATA